MDYLQYLVLSSSKFITSLSFKPYYKWITFNTLILAPLAVSTQSFKPYYKWITFNTEKLDKFKDFQNLFSFKPYYKWITFNT